MLRKALPEAERLGDIEWTGWCQKDLGQALLAQGQREEGLRLLRGARESLAKAGLDQSWPEPLAEIDALLK